MRLNLFQSIVSFLVLFASCFIIAHAEEHDVPFVGCKSLIGCNEKYEEATFCESLMIYVRPIEGTYTKCLTSTSCTNGTFGKFTPS